MALPTTRTLLRRLVVEGSQEVPEGTFSIVFPWVIYPSGNLIDGVTPFVELFCRRTDTLPALAGWRHSLGPGAFPQVADRRWARSLTRDGSTLVAHEPVSIGGRYGYLARLQEGPQTHWHVVQPDVDATVYWHAVAPTGHADAYWLQIETMLATWLWR
jgi:hypothetical protein